jgi:hypothetical protein
VLNKSCSKSILVTARKISIIAFLNLELHFSKRT